MRSLSEIDTTSKRASRAAGYSWGISEEVEKNVRLLEMFGLPGIKNLNDYYNKKKEQKNYRLFHNRLFKRYSLTKLGSFNFPKSAINFILILGPRMSPPKITPISLRYFPPPS